MYYRQMAVLALAFSSAPAYANYTGVTCDFSGPLSWEQSNGISVDGEITQTANNDITFVGTSSVGSTTCNGTGKAGGRALYFTLVCTDSFGSSTGIHSGIVDFDGDLFTGTTYDRNDPWSVGIMTSDRVFLGCP